MVKISVIIPVYNAEKYLRKCLDSIIKQTLKDIEIICVDDCSTDNSLKILNDYASKNCRIKVIHLDKNKKQGGARNAGLDIARGKYIMFVDSDDYLELNIAEEFLKKIQESKADIVISHVENFSQDEKNLKATQNFQCYYNKLKKSSGIYKFEGDFTSYRSGPTAKLFVKDIIDKYKIRFPENIINEDEAFHWMYFSLINSIYYTDTPYYKRRIHSDSTMQLKANHGIGVIDELEVIKFVFKFFKENNLLKKYNKILNVHYICRKIEMKNRCCNFDKNLLQKFQKDCAKFEKVSGFGASYTFLEKIFSVKNEPIRNKYKIITILGLKIKVKKETLRKILFFGNQPSKDNKWYKVIYILGLKFSIRNRKKERQIAIEQEKQFIKNSLNSLTRQNNDLKNSVNSLSNQNSDLKIVVDDLSSQNNELKNRLDNLSKQNEKLQKDIVEQKEEQNVLIAQCNKLKSELSQIKEWQLNFHKLIPQKFPISLSDNEIQLLCKKYNSSKNYLEFGSGGSTFLALINSNTNIYSVESDLNWLEYLRSYNIISTAETNNRLHFQHIDIGETKEWGYPVNDDKKCNYPEYSNTIFEKIKDIDIDLVFIDGRFRVACIIAAILNCNPNTCFMIHDYTIREYYHVVEEFLDIVEQQDTLVVFKAKPNIQIDRLKEVYEEHKFIKE